MNDTTIIVVEVGLSNTLNQLRTKARTWLTAFDDMVRIIDPSARTITIEAWEMVSRVLPQATSSRRPGKEQRIDITVDAKRARHCMSMLTCYSISPTHSSNGHNGE